MSKNKVYIIGVSPGGVSGLSSDARRIIERSEMLIGSKRLLALFSTSKAQKVSIGHNLGETTGIIRNNLGQKRIVVMATGDPNFFGIARYLGEEIGRNAIEVLPNVSTMQLAFARIKESWDDAVFASVHSRPIESIVDIVRSNSKICILTDEKNDPGEVASVLLRHGIGNCCACVCQDLGSTNEKVIRTDLNHLPGSKFSPVNILILIKDKRQQRSAPVKTRILGIPDSKFKRRNRKKSLITKLEVRAVSIAKLGLTEDCTVWDVGAGTGAVSIEISSLARKGRVFAIEKNAEDIQIIRENIKRFGRDNIEVVHAVAPRGLEDLPRPDAVFIGGSGGQIKNILSVVCHKLRARGHVVVNVATLENLQAVCDQLGNNGFSFETTLLNIARSKQISGLTRFEPLNPVFIIAGQRLAARTVEHG